MAAAGPVKAALDVKTFHASGGCKVYGATPWTSLGFGWQGIANTTNSPVQIVCPLVTDSETAWSAAASTAYVHAHARSGGVAASVSCSVFTVFGTGLVDSYTFSMPMAANSQTNANSTYLNTTYADDGGVLMMCQLGPKTTLIHYTL
jgi:hypothetical protein